MSWTKQTETDATWTMQDQGYGFLTGDGFLTGWGFLQEESDWTKQTETNDTWTKVT